MAIYRNPQPLSYPKDATITDVLLNYNLNNTPSTKAAIIDGLSGEVVFTYGSFRDSVRKVARHLSMEMGVAPGAVVGLISTNRNYFPVFVHAVLAVGAVVSAMNPLYEPNEIAHALRLSKPSYIFVEQALLPRVTAALSSIPTQTSRPSLYIWDTTRGQEGVAEAVSIQHIILHGSADYEPASLPPGAAATKLAFICFSSGTSGLVKGVRLSHRNVVANTFQQSQALSGMFAPSTVVALVVPFFHILGLAGFSCQYICQGTPIVAFRRFEIGPLCRAIAKHRITHINVVPPIALALLQNPLIDGADVSSVQCLMNAAAPLRQAQADQLSRRLGCVVTQWYGMTEASPAIASQREDEAIISNTIGRLLPGIGMRIIDEEGNGKWFKAHTPSRDTLLLSKFDLTIFPGGPDTNIGEFAIRGPNMMLGYVEAEGSQPSFMTSDGFMKTGDIGYVDDKGYLFIVDRAKEMIKVKGNQVAPAELEAILISHPSVNDAAVCGVYDEHGTSEIPVGYITTDVRSAEGQRKLKAEVLKYVHSQVARYKQLKGGLHILPAIPRNPSGKILRRLLPAKVATTTSHAVGDKRQARAKI